MNKKNTLLLLFIIGLVLTSCKWDPFSLFAEHFYEDCIYVLNNSDKHICFYVSDTYPDTFLVAQKPNLKKVESGKEDRIVLNSQVNTPLNWKKAFPCDTVMVFIFDNRITEISQWDSIRNNYVILKRYDVSLDNLKQMDYKIVYPN